MIKLYFLMIYIITMGAEHSSLCDDIPAPEDDGEADHLSGRSVPSVELTATDGEIVNLSTIPGRVIVYCFPKMGRTAEEPDPDGWEQIPGAYGCTEESCLFRDHYDELLAIGLTEVYALSLQTSDHQRDARSRVEPQYHFLSDAEQVFTSGLGLPTFEVEGKTFNKRLTLVLLSGKIEHVFYPVFPPGEHAEEVIRWLESNPADGSKS